MEDEKLQSDGTSRIRWVNETPSPELRRGSYTREEKPWEESCGSVDFRIWFSHNLPVHTPPTSPVGSKQRSGVYQNPAHPAESEAGIEVTSRIREQIEPNEADRHYEYEDAIFKHYVKQAIEEHKETEQIKVNRILDRGTKITPREQDRVTEWRTTHRLEEKKRVAYCELEKVRKLLRQKERQHLLAKGQLQEWRQLCQDWDNEENVEWDDWRQHSNYTSD
jgi:hypothetical protein